jgi:hypothetical protein
MSVSKVLGGIVLMVAVCAWAYLAFTVEPRFREWRGANRQSGLVSGNYKGGKAGAIASGLFVTAISFMLLYFVTRSS